jgi:transcriptional regulator with XRE-family HTH domain
MEDNERIEFLYNFGQKVKHYRMKLGLTQRELGLKVGYLDATNPAAAIYKIEKGQMEITQTKIADIAKALGVTPADLFSDKLVENVKDDEETLIVESYMHADEATKRHVWLLLNDKPKPRPSLSIYRVPDFSTAIKKNVENMIIVPNQDQVDRLSTVVKKLDEQSVVDKKNARKIVKAAVSVQKSSEDKKTIKRRRNSGSGEIGGLDYVGN